MGIPYGQGREAILKHTSTSCGQVLLLGVEGWDATLQMYTDVAEMEAGGQKSDIC